MDASEDRVVLAPQLGRLWWIVMVTMAVVYAVLVAVVAARHGRWQFLPLMLVVSAVAVLPLWWARRRMRVTLAHGLLTRPMGRVRIAASDLVNVSTAPGAMARRAVVVTTRAGDMVPLGLDGPDAHHAVVAARTIRAWAERHGADFSRVAVGPAPLADDMVLRPARRMVAFATALLAGTWIGFAIRAASTPPPVWVVVCGVLGTLPAVAVLPRLLRVQIRIEGESLLVNGLRREVRVAAQDVAGVDLDSSQYVRVLRTNGRPVSLMVRGRSAAGLPGRVTAWAQAHGGGIGEPLTTAERVDWLWSLSYGVVLALALTPIFWALSPHDPERWYFPFLGGMCGSLLGPLLNGRRTNGRGTNGRGANDRGTAGRRARD